MPSRSALSLCPTKPGDLYKRRTLREAARRPAHKRFRSLEALAQAFPLPHRLRARARDPWMTRWRALAQMEFWAYEISFKTAVRRGPRGVHRTRDFITRVPRRVAW